MIRSRELLGISVVDRMSGRKLGKICGVDYRPGEKWFRGLVVESCGLRRQKRYLRREDIWLLGRHAVLAAGPLRILPSVKPLGDAIYTPDGQLWGRISAFRIDPASGQVAEAEVRVSLLEDLLHGCRLVQAASQLAVRDGRVLYHPPEKNIEERM